MSDSGGFGRRSVLKMAGVAGIGLSMAEAPKAEEGAGDPSEILVGVDESAGDVQSTVEGHLSSVEKTLSTSADVVHSNDVLGYATVRLTNADASTRRAAIEEFSEKPDVSYAEKNGRYRALYTPNDPEFSNQYAPQMVNAPDAWDTTFGDSSVKIAVVDQGVKYDHPDLVDNMDTSVTNHGYDFVDSDGDPYPDDLSDSGEYHGTHVAGIAAAVTDNGTGVAGISDASILSVRVLDETGGGTWSDIADGVQYAADQGADVINMSLGGTSDSSTLENAVAYAHSMGVLIVVAAGNDYRNNSTYPARYDECVSVAALDSSGSLASYSNVGKEIELSAPGSSVLSTWVDDGYDTISGTSMATPVVAGVAALAKSQHGIGGEDLRRHLKETAADIGLPDGEQGAGRVDANAAVSTSPQENYHAHLGENWTGNPSGNYGLRVESTSDTRFGVMGFSNETKGRGVYGRAYSTTGTTRGLSGRVDSHTDGAAALAGRAAASSGRTYGFVGRSDSTEGVGAFALAPASSGSTLGLEGRSASDSGTGVLGNATASSGLTTGVEGRNNSSSGGATGVHGNATASSGTTYGVKGTVNSSSGYGLYTPDDARIGGDLNVVGNKNFVQTVSTDAGRKEVAYTAVEADAAHTETSGVAELDDGRAEIDLPEHFGLVTSEAEDLVVQLTPYGGTEGLKVVERSTDHVVVESLGDVDDYEFAYTVRGTRAGHEDDEVVSDVPGTVSPDVPTVPDHTEK